MKKILIIEDNESNRYLLKYMLEKAEYEVIEVSSGEDGIELLKKERVDLILMDIQLPGIDGIETTKKIRKSKLNGEIPIIAITSYAMAGDKEKALKAGCTGYIEKPIDPEKIIDQIEGFI